jgi:TRAP-type C4-dicarboxylate transport system substrate-binding protein
MGNDQVVLRKIRQGQLHGGTFTAGGVSSEYRDYQVLSLPMLFQNYKQVDAARAAVEAKLTKGLEQRGYVSFGIMEAGFVYMMSNVPIDSLETLRGRKVWIPEGDPIGARAFKELGVPPTPLPLPDVMTGLQTGLLDTVSSSPVGTIVLQWFTKVKYLIESPLLYSYGTIAIAKSAWDKLAAADQQVVREAFTGISGQLDKQNRIDNDRAMVALKQQGLRFIPISPANHAQMQAIANKTIDSLVAEIRAIAAANK